jgi:mRNA interferase RelE/StbE
MSSGGHYEVLKSSSAGRDLKKLQKTLAARRFARLDGKISRLSLDPRPPGCEDMTGTSNEYRLRDGDYRILYSVDDSRFEVRVTRVRDRKEVYRH